MARKKRKNGKKSLLGRSVFMLGVVALVIFGRQIKNKDSLDELVIEASKAMNETTELLVKEVEKIVEQDNIEERIPLMDSSTFSDMEIPLVRDSDTRILKRTGYTLSYNDTWRIPNWVAWQLTGERVNGKVKRSDEFVVDPDLPDHVRSEHRDYSGSRYDRGHMAPAGDMKWDERAMQESFYMSNMCPQAPNLNKGDWRVLEERCRKWAERYGTLFIACGPIVNESVNHKKIGRSNKVLVPDGFFKVVLKLGEHPSAIGFIFPNDDCDLALDDYAVSVDSVEAVTGFDFFYRLADEQENLLESQKNIKW